MRDRIHRAGTAVLVAALFATAGSLRAPRPADAAAAISWSGLGDGHHWSDAANWYSGTVPGDGDSVVIQGDGRTLVNDLPGGTHLSSFVFSSEYGMTLSGAALTVDWLQVSHASVQLTLSVATDTTWDLEAGSDLAAIDLNGHHLTFAQSSAALRPHAGASERPVVHAPARQAGIHDIVDSVGGGEVSIGDSVITLVGASSWTGTITASHGGAIGALLVAGDWPNVDYTGGSLGLAAVRDPTWVAGGGRVGSATLTDGEAWTGLNASTIGGALTLRAPSTLAVAVPFHERPATPLIVEHGVHIEQATLTVTDAFNDDRYVRSLCPDGLPIIDNAASGPVDGHFGAVRVTPSIPQAFDDLTFTVRYDGGDGNDVVLVCALSATPTTERTVITGVSNLPGTEPTTTTTASPELPNTGGDDPGFAAVGALLLAVGFAATRFARRRSA